MGYARHNENDMAIKMRYKKPDLWKIATQIQQFKQRDITWQSLPKTMIATLPPRMSTDDVFLETPWLNISEN